MPAPLWFWRFLYDRESASWVRRRDEPENRKLVERRADQLARVVPAPGPVADLGCGPGAHARALARRGYDVTGLDGSPQMVEVARDRATSDGTPVTFAIHDVRKRLPFADGSLGGALAILVIQHLPDPGSFVTDIRRCLRPGGHLVITAPARDIAPLTTPSLYWRLRAAGAHVIPGVVRFYDRESLPRLVESAGFSVVDYDQVGAVSLMARA